MKRSRFAEKQIIGILKEHQVGPGAKELCRKLCARSTIVLGPMAYKVSPLKVCRTCSMHCLRREGLKSFPRAASAKIILDSVKSDTARLSRVLSVSSPFSRLT